MLLLTFFGVLTNATTDHALSHTELLFPQCWLMVIKPSVGNFILKAVPFFIVP